MTDSAIFHATHTLTWQDIDCNGNMSLRALANMMQEAAWQHAEDLGFGFSYMVHHQAVWVLLGIRAEFYRQPRWQDSVRLESWHKGYKGVVALRDFIFSNSQGEPIAKTSTDWTLINHETRRIVRPNILDPFTNTAILNDILPDFEIYDDSDTSDMSETCRKVEFSDIDFNGHVNNACYFDWIANVFELLNTHKKRIGKMTIKYQSECVLGEMLRLRYALSDNSFHIEGLPSSDGKKVFDSILGLDNGK